MPINFKNRQAPEKTEFIKEFAEEAADDQEATNEQEFANDQEATNEQNTNNTNIPETNIGDFAIFIYNMVAKEKGLDKIDADEAAEIKKHSQRFDYWISQKVGARMFAHPVIEFIGVWAGVIFNKINRYAEKEANKNNNAIDINGKIVNDSQVVK